MSTTPTDRLYSLLPTIYRVRDIDQGEPLRALMEVMEQQFLALEEDIDQLYDNWFIETCEEWVVPYIGELLGVKGLNSVGNGAFSLRSYVGNTFAYRQAKGTPAILEQLAHDVTGWPTRVVEYFQRLGWTQNMNHRRMYNHLIDLRNVIDLHAIGGPFETAVHTAEVRRIAPKRGRYNIPNIGIIVWRLAAYPMLLSRAIPVTFVEGDIEDPSNAGDGRYHFHPYNIDMQLFNRPQAETELYHLAEEVNVPGTLARRTLYEELEARRAAIANGLEPSPVFFTDQPPFRLYVDGSSTPVPFEQIVICNLSTWRRPDVGFIAVDPELGRICFHDPDEPPNKVHVDYCYGFSADIGGGPYNRRGTLTTGDSTVWHKTVGKSGADFDNIRDALADWTASTGSYLSSDGILEIIDSDIYSDGTFTPGDSILGPIDFTSFDITVPADTTLTIQARDGVRPVLYTHIFIGGPGRLIINGVMIFGVVVIGGGAGAVNFLHCTLWPAQGLSGRAIYVDIVGGDNLQLSIKSSIVGHIALDPTTVSVTIEDSIVDATSYADTDVFAGYALAGNVEATTGGIPVPGPKTTIVRSTVFGKVYVSEVDMISESIITDTTIVKRRQTGCVRFSYLPVGSKTPRRYYCQPDKAIAAATTTADAAIAPEKVRPDFTSIHFGDPGYAQLSFRTATEIRTGAEDGSEMGVFNQLKQSQREANLRAGLDEAMRLGLEAGIFFAT
jgi:hypothetical protein